MEPTFLSLSEAAELTQRSPSTIRRMVQSITNAKNHPDRKGIEPTPSAVAGFKKKGENFAWKISQEVLDRHLKSALEKEKKIMKKSSVDVPKDILQILQKELDMKSQQIEKQWEVISALNERLREGNILMGSLQQRLALPNAEAQASKTDSMEDTIEADIHTTMKPSTETTTKSSGNRFFNWLRK